MKNWPGLRFQPQAGVAGWIDPRLALKRQARQSPPSGLSPALEAVAPPHLIEIQR